MTFSESDLLCLFLKAAKKGVQDDEKFLKGKQFEVLVCETAPSFKGHATAQKLSKEGIQTKVITDASVYALMSGVDKVIISTHAIMADGGLIAHAGAYQIALAAKEFSIPVIVVSAMYKLTPKYPFDPLKLNELLAPSSIMSYEDGDVPENIEAVVP